MEAETEEAAVELGGALEYPDSWEPTDLYDGLELADGHVEVEEV